MRRDIFHHFMEIAQWLVLEAIPSDSVNVASEFPVIIAMNKINSQRKTRVRDVPVH